MSRPTGSVPPAEVIDIRQQVEARRLEEAEAFAQEDEERKGKGPGGPDDSDFVLQCLANNELGDGVLFATLHRGRFIYDATSGDWFAWLAHYWQRDIESRSLAAVEDVAARYVQEWTAVGRQLAATTDEERAAFLKGRSKAILRRVDRLRSVKGRRNCREFAATLPSGALVVTGDRLDAKPWLLACKNGVVDLVTGGFRAGKPEDYLTKAAPVEWKGIDEPAPHFERFLLDVMDGDQEMVDYLRRVFGYSITGSTREHIFLILHGAGRNGKGTLLETLQKVLGPLAGPIPSEMLLNQPMTRSAAGPSPDIMALRGLRLAFASETDKGRRFAASRVKLFSGGDTLTGRNPHDRVQIAFPPSHLLILATNFKPKADAEDPAFWARMHLVDFPLSFVENPTAPNERPIDKTLEEKLPAEAPGILAWLVRGCLEWQLQGLRPPKKILAATAEYRRAEDDLADFLEEKCIIDEDSSTTAKELYTSFKGWFAANISEKGIPSQKRFGEMVTRRFEKSKNACGNVVYSGLELRDRSI